MPETRPHAVFRPDFLDGRVALVTGGGTGICRGITEALLRHGCRAVITSRKADVLARAAAEMTETTGRTCLGVPADVRRPDEVEAAFDRTLEAFGRVDIVINGAAGNFLAPAATLSYNAFRTVMEIDALGTFNVSKAAFTKYLGAHGGNIVNISATLHYKGTPLQTHPGSAKAAVDAMTRHLAVEWGAAGIRVNAIAPGPIDETEGMKRLAPGDVKQKVERQIPLGRFGRIDEIADATLFLVSDAATYITGTVLVVDGGAWMTMSSLVPWE
jgi:peroxisomal 2,4-dienoyl-CoA reductase